MKRLYIGVSVCTAGFLAFAPMAQADPVFMVAQIQIEDQTTYFGSYGKSVAPLLQKSGAKILVATPKYEQLEGAWQGNWTVVIEFPTEKQAKDWYHSPEYQGIRPTRLNSTSFGNMVLLPGFTVPPQTN